jgi:hypothetical protein
MSERREFWIYQTVRITGVQRSVRNLPPMPSEIDWYDDIIPVVEIREGEIVLSRKQLMQVFARAYCTEENKHKVLDPEIAYAMLDELFGKRSE